jgi:hypothetical protein
MNDSHGRLFEGTEAARMDRNPTTNPEPPAPAMARPMMNIFDEVDKADTKDPTSNIAKPTKKLTYEV